MTQKALTLLAQRFAAIEARYIVLKDGQLSWWRLLWEALRPNRMRSIHSRARAYERPIHDNGYRVTIDNNLARYVLFRIRDSHHSATARRARWRGSSSSSRRSARAVRASRASYSLRMNVQGELVSRTKHHRDALSPRRYLLKDRPPRHRVLHALWHLRDAWRELYTLQGRR